MKANRFNKVMSSLSPDWGSIKIEEEIGDHPKDVSSYHVLVVDRTHIASQERYETNARVIKYRLEAWPSMEKDFPRIGIKNYFILHDPTLKAEPVKKEVSEDIEEETEAPKRGRRKQAE